MPAHLPDDHHPDRLFWERLAPRYDRSTRLLGRPLPQVRELVVETVAEAGSLLEVAAGTGYFSLGVAPRVGRLVATDYAGAMVGVLRERVAAAGLSNVECTQADLYALDFPPGSFDAVIAANVLHLVPDLPRALGSLRRVLRPGGVLVAPTFTHDETLRSRLLSRLLSLLGTPLYRRFTAASLRRALEEAGWRVTRLEVVPGPLPVAFIVGEVLGVGR